MQFPKRSLPIFLLAVTAFASSALGREPLTIDFSGKPAFRAEERKPDGIVTTTRMVPGSQGRDVFIFSWPAHEGPHVAAYLVNPGPILVAEPGKYKIDARVCTRQIGAECIRLGLRVNDVHLEIYQLFAPVRHDEPGWTTMTWILDTAHPLAGGSAPWGGDKNQCMDLPLRLRGFALPFTHGKTGGGTLWVDTITVTPLSR